jgi:hypothetical protein
MFAAAERGESFETSELHCVSCGFPLGEFNWAFLKQRDGSPARAIERAERFFDERRFPFRFVVKSDCVDAWGPLLAERGHARQPATTPGMSIAPIPDPPAAPDGLRIVRVDSARTLADFQQTSFGGFGLPAAAAPLFLTERLLDSLESALLVGYVGDAAVSTSMLMATGRVAGIYWVSTLEAHRRRGYAEALTWAALDAGRALGCTIGSLQASELGCPVYARMGFSQTAEYVFFQRPKSR